MIKTVGIVSLSRGTIGEDFVKHEVDLGIRRLKDFGLEVRFMPHALKGIEYVAAHPEKRAADLLEALRDPSIDMILCAIGGDDTYRLLPHLLGSGELAEAVGAAGDKVFLGFSDTTINHFMLHKVGMKTFYGQSFLADVCEMGPEMLPYSRKYFEELLRTGHVEEVRPSDVWYDERTEFDVSLMGTPLPSHKDKGFELLQGPAKFSGKVLGGCIDSIYDIFDGERYADMPELCEKYGLWPSAEDWRGRILLLESSEEKMSPEKYRKALCMIKERGVFDVISGVLVGKPQNEVYEAEYKEALKDVVGNPQLPILCNINIGHAHPRCIIPFGVEATVDATEQRITFNN
ncbi:MAG: LD-carboxypeptidase [Firmicutes bacterium]|nr:LD-carboxypeptidase [Bacillota bacterium]